MFVFVEDSLSHSLVSWHIHQLNCFTLTHQANKIKENTKVGSEVAREMKMLDCTHLVLRSEVCLVFLYRHLCLSKLAIHQLRWGGRE